jgi:hypothetical protein
MSLLRAIPMTSGKSSKIITRRKQKKCLGKEKDIFKRAGLIKETEIIAIKKFTIPLNMITMSPEEFESETSLITEYAKQGEVMFGV